MLLASGVGLVVLGDVVEPGHAGWLLIGLVIVFGGVLAMAYVGGRGSVRTSGPSPIKRSAPARCAVQETS